MSPPADPLRNTLDQLALDPGAKEDRRYLVSVLRRLGYSETEIREALGEPRGGEEGRLIELEYTGEGPAVVTDEPSGPEGDEGTFTVVGDEPAFESDAEPAAGEDWSEEEGWSEQWHDEAWAPEEDAGEDVVEFIERRDPSGEVGFSVAPGTLEGRRIPDARHGDAGRRRGGASGGSRKWEPVEAPRDRRQWEPVERPASDHPAVRAGWQPVSAQEVEQRLAESRGTERDWDRPDEAPGGSWEPVEPAAGDWEEAAEPAGADEWEPASEWDETEPAVPEPAGKPFTLDDYTLYTRGVELSNGTTQDIYFFAKSQPKSGTPAPLPDGYTVERNARTSLPYLRRSEAGGTTKGGGRRGEARKAKGKAGKGGGTTATADRCPAITKGGTQCKNHHREGSKYCGTHKGWRGPRADA